MPCTYVRHEGTTNRRVRCTADGAHRVRALAPFLLLTTSRWAERAADLATLVLRSVGANVLSLVSALAIMASVGSSDPGASAHGGVFLALFFLVPIGVVLGAMTGVMSALCSFSARST